MSNLPLVTIGVPNRNYAHYILEALNSVINQSFENIELIIVDDVSTDDSIIVVQNWIDRYNGGMKIRFIKNETNLGLTKVCNLILKNASGKYIQFLDADDMISVGKIKRQVEVLEVHPDAALVYSDVSVIDESGLEREKSYLKRIGYNSFNMPSGDIHRRLFDANFIPLPSVLIRVNFIEMVGGFDETVAVQDYFLWLKLTEKHEVRYIDETLAQYRVHGQSMSNDKSTNPRSVDSILIIIFRYYKNADKEVRHQIKQLLHSSSANLYRLRYPTAEKWLKQDLVVNRKFKSLVYYAAIKLGISYRFFERLKSIF